MQRQISVIRQELEAHPARGAWDNGAKVYAQELFDELVSNRHITDDTTRLGKITEADLLNGADDWEQFSRGGCALVYDSDICERLCCPSMIKKTRCGDRPPNSTEDWMDWQTKALKQAARLVLRIANRRD